MCVGIYIKEENGGRHASVRYPHIQPHTQPTNPTPHIIQPHITSPHHTPPPPRPLAKALSAAEAKDLKEVEAGLPKLAAEAKAAQEALAKKTSARCVLVVFVCVCVFFWGVCMGLWGGGVEVVHFIMI